jgi:hypothetical protein
MVTKGYQKGVYEWVTNGTGGSVTSKGDKAASAGFLVS